MRRSFYFFLCLSLSLFSKANTITVKNIAELNEATAVAKPGDIIIMNAGEWNNITIELNCIGTAEHPITIKSAVAGKVVISGHSQLKLGGNYIVVDGLYFINGFAGNTGVIEFRTSKDQLANNCRVTNCVINDFNNPKRLQENNWVSLYGKHNRVDHCSFINKKNMGVLMAVLLDDDRSRENFHLIDHNYFGLRLPLASNSGEIIRVGLAQHCQFNSNTQITDNFFEHCDGETEIISIKSCSNLVANNVFKECQGGVVLRHGNENTVTNNIFLGNNKEGTGGVRIINKGQWVVNNFFYQCRGVDFRSPMSVMNGIPNSPPTRYVQVSDAFIANNTYYNCSSLSLCEGSDTERTLPPVNVWMVNNLFYNDRDTIIYKTYDNINGFHFSGNEVSKIVPQALPSGFTRASFTTQKNDNVALPVSSSKSISNIPDSINTIAKVRLQHSLTLKAGFTDLMLIKKLTANAYTQCGSAWFNKLKAIKATVAPVIIQCATASDIYHAVERNVPVDIRLTRTNYEFEKPILISNRVTVTGQRNIFIEFHTLPMLSLFMIKGNGSLNFSNIEVAGSDVKATHFISSDSSGSANHYQFTASNSKFSYFTRGIGCENFFYAYPSSVADSIIIRNCYFESNKVNTFMLGNEKDSKGYYSVEKMQLTDNTFDFQEGVLIDLLRGGVDESTLGPDLLLSDNVFSNCNTYSALPLISLTGVQKSRLFFNSFTECNTGKTLLIYKDFVRANHELERNVLGQSGAIQTNRYVTSKSNTIL